MLDSNGGDIYIEDDIADAQEDEMLINEAVDAALAMIECEDLEVE